LKKHVLLVLALFSLAVALLALAACSPVPSAPAATATNAPAIATPAAPATQAVPLTVQAPVSGTVPVSATVPAPVEGQRPLAQIPPAERNDRFSGPAAKYTKDNTNYVATIVTDKGNIVAELYPDAVEGVNNFVTLAEDGFYDGLTFHRVEPGFVIQGGDPLGQGNGGPGYTIPAEIKHEHLKGALAWARTGDEVNPERASSGSQFYITLAETPFLDGAYSVFGQVTEGMDVAEKIAVGDKIQRIDISTTTTSKLPTPGPTRTPVPSPTATVTPTPYAPSAQAGRPLATVEVAKRDKYFNKPPAMTIDKTKKYEATIDTTKGKIVVELDSSLSPNTVNNFVTLANLGFYDGMPVAHAAPGTFVIMGSPKSSPESDAGYTLPLEYGDQVTSTITGTKANQIVTGTLAMYPLPDAQGNPVASGSSFYISFTAVQEGATPMNVLGKVVSGMDVAEKLVGASSQPVLNAQGTPEPTPPADIINSITITEK
jgi:cyclophilin family peptidyl-prolyl cis-trans isomerase